MFDIFIFPFSFAPPHRAEGSCFVCWLVGLFVGWLVHRPGRPGRVFFGPASPLDPDAAVIDADIKIGHGFSPFLNLPCSCCRSRRPHKVRPPIPQL